jgi:fructose-1,6-bisphosphatase/inositol monophosphatase family enzyme
VDDDDLLEVLMATAEAVRSALDGIGSDEGGRPGWRAAGRRPGQYQLDLVADAAALVVLHGAGLAVLSEESGLTGPAGAGVGGDTAELLVVLDPVDGSTNASLGIPWYATSLCVVDRDGARVALVVNQALGVRYEAVRGGGARRDGRPIAPSGCSDIGRAVIGVSGIPRRPPTWWQVRALGSAALDHCLVAEGVLDGYAVAGGTTLNSWDYLGGMLVCLEAGAVVVEAEGKDLVVRDDSPRRPLAAATQLLSERLLEAVREDLDVGVS